MGGWKEGWNLMGLKRRFRTCPGAEYSFIDPKQNYCSKCSVANEIMSLQSRSLEISESSSLSEFGSALFCFLRAKGGQVKSTGYFLGYDPAVA